jgi:hypothetical protein
MSDSLVEYVIQTSLIINTGQEDKTYSTPGDRVQLIPLRFVRIVAAVRGQAFNMRSS